MQHVFLIHWQNDEIDAFAAPLRDAGWRVDTETDDGADAVSRMRAEPPDVVAISLRRLPSHGRRTAAQVRAAAATRDLPIVFFDGDDEASGQALVEVDGAVHCSWVELPRVLEEIVPR